MNNRLLNYRRFMEKMSVFIFIMTIIFSTASAGVMEMPQQTGAIQVTGQLKDATGETLPGATIVEKGTTNGTITDIDGNFSIKVQEEAVLIASFVGYETQEIPVNGRSTVNITLSPDFKTLNEVVVVGYGTAKKSDLTGSVATVSAEDFDKIPVSNPLDILQGRAPGLSITSNSGAPGASATVRVRGERSIQGGGATESPIYVVDGVIRTSIDNLNPNDIENISVLKDASAAAIYGARAANGVIIVTTKRGSSLGPQKPEISYNVFYGLQTESNLKLNLLNTQQFIDIRNEAEENAGNAAPGTADALAAYPDGINTFTDWRDLITRNGIIKNHSLSLAGSGEKSNYYVSAGYFNHQGVVIGTNQDKFTLTFNTDHKINDWLTFGNSLIVSDNTVNGSGNGGEDYYNLALRKSPISSNRNEDDSDFAIIINPNLEHIYGNPIWQSENRVDEVKTKTLQGSLYLKANITDGLDFTIRGSYDYTARYQTTFIGGVSQRYGWEGGTLNSLEKDYRETNHWITDYLLNYNKTFGDHDLSGLLGYSVEENRFENLVGAGGATPNNGIRFLNAGDPGAAPPAVENGFNDWAFVSTFGRIGYNYQSKYFASATFRRDGTSRLPSDTRYGFFPSASLAWKISEESFFAGVKSTVDNLKLRASFGTLGNIVSLANYPTIADLNGRDVAIDGGQSIGFTVTDAINTGIVWERTEKKNLGLDFSLFTAKLYGSFDYFIEDTFDGILNRSLSLSTGIIGDPIINLGQVRNDGYEIVLGYRDTKGDWNYDVSANLTHFKNEVLDIGDNERVFSGGNTVTEVGSPVRSRFGYKTNGIIRDEADLVAYEDGQFTSKEVGDLAILDIDGRDDDGNLTGQPDGIIDGNDRAVIGRKFPNLNYGLVGSLGYKNWNLRVQLQGVQGVDQYIGPTGTLSVIQLMSSFPRNEDARVLNRFHPENNPTGTWPRVSVSDQGSNTNSNDFWFQDASYLRIRNVNLSYTIPSDVVGKIGMSNLQVYTSVQNLYTFTQFEGPEVDVSGDSFTNIPQPRTWTLGLRATF